MCWPGTLTNEGDSPGIGHSSRTVTWNLVRSKPTAVELIVTPTCAKSSVEKCTYDTWLPEPGPNEIMKGSVMKISLKLQGKNGKPLTQKVEYFELKLANTSREPGITINAPLSPRNDQLPDLRFLLPGAPESIEEDQTITVNSPDDVTGSAEIASFDGGGYSVLTAVAVLKNGQRINGNLLNSGGEREVQIPKRDPASKISSAWLQANGNPDEKDDAKKLDGNNHPGDGLSAYEEYRGVISEGKFRRLDPKKMELGILMKRTEFPIFAGGISLFESATGIKPIRFDETEIGPDRKLNKNVGSAHVYNQFAEYLLKDKLEEGTAGENQPAEVTAKTPANSKRVVIDVNQIKSQYQQQVTRLNQASQQLKITIKIPYTDAEDVANTVAHELTHGVNVNHHGKPTLKTDVPSISEIPLKSLDIFHIYDEEGSEITEPGFPIKGLIGKTGNEESGDLSCIMAYTSLYNWAFRVGNDGSLIFHKVPLLPVGKNLCKTKIGNDINDKSKLFGEKTPGNKYFGDATYGDCVSQIKLRD